MYRMTVKDRIIITLARWLIILVSSTLRVIKRGDATFQRIYDRGENVIIAFWHRKLFYMGYAGSRFYPQMKAHVMVSQSRDGTRIGRVVEKMGVGFVQGSTTRGGGQAFRELARLLKKGDFAAITPDGPRGPRGTVHKGIVVLARLTGRPIIPVTYHVSRFVELRTWDRFILPLPFSKVALISGDPIVVKPDSSEDDGQYESLIKERMEELERANPFVRQEKKVLL